MKLICFKYLNISLNLPGKYALLHAYASPYNVHTTCPTLA